MQTKAFTLQAGLTSLPARHGGLPVLNSSLKPSCGPSKSLPQAQTPFKQPFLTKHINIRRSTRRHLVSVLARAGTVENLALFPLGLVALPTAEVPLQIFEARYRVLFSTLLAGSDGIDDGLISEDKPWCGTKRFGMAFMDPKSRGVASIGTVLEITQHNMMDDGRLLINSIGRERFRILDVVEERPVLVCKVEYLNEDEDVSQGAEALKDEVASLFLNTVRLSGKLRDITIQDSDTEERMKEMSPRELSFWVASLFANNAYQQQALLEEDSTMARLKVEEELLSNTLKYMSAQAALQSAFSTGGSEGEAPTSD